MCDKPRCVLKRLEKEIRAASYAARSSQQVARYHRWASDLSTVLEQSYVDKIPEPSTPEDTAG